MTTLTIELESADPVLVGAAVRLIREWHGRVRVSLKRVPGSASTRHWVRLSRGSVVRGAVSITWGIPFAEHELGPAWRLALTSAAWDDVDELEPWRLLSMPLPSLARLGRPDPSREWVIVPRTAILLRQPAEAVGAFSTLRLASLRLASPSVGPSHHVSSRLGLVAPGESRLLPDLERADHAQFHFLGIPAASQGRTHVAWWPSRRVVASLLGHATTLVAPAGPLAFDAWRAGLEVLNPCTLEPLAPELAGQQLAGLVPPRLLRCPQLWRHVADQTRAAADGAIPLPLCTAEWLGEAESVPQNAFGAAIEHAVHKLQKLRRRPRRFCAESRSSVLRAVGKQIWG